MALAESASRQPIGVARAGSEVAWESLIGPHALLRLVTVSLPLLFVSEGFGKRVSHEARFLLLGGQFWGFVDHVGVDHAQIFSKTPWERLHDEVRHDLRSTLAETSSLPVDRTADVFWKPDRDCGLLHGPKVPSAERIRLLTDQGPTLESCKIWPSPGI